MSTAENGDHHEVTVTRSEERLHADAVATPVQRAIIRKVIVEEQRTIQVTLRREEFRLDYAPADAPIDTAAAAPAPLELILHEERVEIVKSVVPVERVRVAVRRVTEAQAVTDTVRAERLEVDGELLPEANETGTGRHRV